MIINRYQLYSIILVSSIIVHLLDGMNKDISKTTIPDNQYYIERTFTDIAPQTIAAGFRQLMYLFDNRNQLSETLLPKTMLVFGKQGTGKTALINGLAQYSNAAIASLSCPSLLSRISDKQHCVENIANIIRNVRDAGIQQAQERYKNFVIIHFDKCNYLKLVSLCTHSLILESLLTIVHTNTTRFTTLLIAEHEETPLEVYLSKFNKVIEVPCPTNHEIPVIMQFHANKVSYQLADSINWSEIIEKTNGLSGSALEKITQHSAILAYHQQKLFIDESHLLKAIDEYLNLKKKCTKSLTDDEIEMSESARHIYS